MAKTKTKYWAVVNDRKGIQKEGTHSECWEYLMTMFEDYTVKQLKDEGVKITRIK